MNISKLMSLIVLGSLFINWNYAQCPIDKTEIIIQFIEEGDHPDEVQWDYKIGDELSGSGPYTITDIITTCIPLGNLTIVGCDTAGDTWNGAILQVTLSNDTTSTACPIQNGCYHYTSKIDDANNVSSCSVNSVYEVANINIGTCEGTPVIISGCTNPLATNYSECAIADDGSCVVQTENNECINAQPINVAPMGECISNEIEINLNLNTLDKVPSCRLYTAADAYYEFIVPNSGRIKFQSKVPTSLGFSLYYNCTGSTVFYSQSVWFPEIINDLTPGDTMILQIFSTYELDTYSFCVEEIEPLLNNICVDAQFIEVAETGNCEMNLVDVSNFSNYTANIQPVCSGLSKLRCFL